MICPVCGKKYSFFKSCGGSGGVYCSRKCSEAATKELDELLEKMIQEENECGQEDAAERNE